MRVFSIAIAGLLLPACASGTASTAEDLPIEVGIVQGPDQTGNDLGQNIAFLKIDFNGDGIVTPYEFRQAKKADFAKYYDTDGDGVLKIVCSVDEFSQRLMSYGSSHPSLTECYAEDGVSAAEFAFDHFFAAHEKWQKSVDTNGDGFITEAEFLSASPEK